MPQQGAPNPRVEAVKRLRKITGLLRSTVSAFADAGASIVYLQPEDRADPNVYSRPRQPQEYPERNLAWWLYLRQQIQTVTSGLASLDDFAQAQIDRLKAEREESNS